MGQAMQYKKGVPHAGPHRVMKDEAGDQMISLVLLLLWGQWEWTLSKTLSPFSKIGGLRAGVSSLSRAMGHGRSESVVLKR